jgi:hypothetical protein
MAISEPALKTVLNRFQVYPAFVNILTSFGAEDGPYTDGRSGFYGGTVKDKTGISSQHLHILSCHWIGKTDQRAELFFFNSFRNGIHAETCRMSRQTRHHESMVCSADGCLSKLQQFYKTLFLHVDTDISPRPKENF